MCSRRKWIPLLSLAGTVLALVGCKEMSPIKPAAIAMEPNRLYWGDTHVHSSYSPDAYFMQNRSADPATAYRWAKGLPVVHPYTRASIRIRTPLDFLVVADHAEMLGVPLKLMQGDPALTSTATGKKWAQMMEAGQGAQIFEHEFAKAIHENRPIADFDDEASKRAAWADIVEAARAANQPCEFTSFIGWEWTSTPGGNNLHRVVFMRDGAEKAAEILPFSSFDSSKPEELWNWLAEKSNRLETDFVAIPHNSNVSGGLMFPEMDSEGRPITAEYARTRMRWEPVAEITQIKGDSETHPSLSPNDELADFERFEHTLKLDGTKAEVAEGDYLRSALLRGMQIEGEVGVNPYKVGFIGSTDAHTGVSSAEEDNFWGKLAIDSVPEAKFVEPVRGMLGADMSASGLAAVWAEENTRAAIFAAFKRKEVYATTGPRIRVRFFGGWDYKDKHTEKTAFVTLAYRYGHPMGSDLTARPEGKSPTFLMYAVKDPKGANLDRMQIVKGWVDAEGKAHEQVYDVAASDDREPDASGRIPPVGNTVDLKTGKYDNSIGAASFLRFWEDPDFDPQQRAFYYLRVLEIPTPRHTLSDALVLGIDPAETGYPATIQERAYSSPIWYTP